MLIARCAACRRRHSSPGRWPGSSSTATTGPIRGSDSTARFGRPLNHPGDTETAETAAAAVRMIDERVRGVIRSPAAADSPMTQTSSSGCTPARRTPSDGIPPLRRPALRRRRRPVRRPDGAGGRVVGLPARRPRAMGDLPDHLRSTTDQLQATPEARDATRPIFAPPMPLPLRPVWIVPVTATIAASRACPPRTACPGCTGDPDGARAGMFGVTRVLNLVFPDAPEVREARRRVQAAAYGLFARRPGPARPDPRCPRHQTMCPSRSWLAHAAHSTRSPSDRRSTAIVHSSQHDITVDRQMMADEVSCVSPRQPRSSIRRYSSRPRTSGWEFRAPGRRPSSRDRRPFTGERRDPAPLEALHRLAPPHGHRLMLSSERRVPNTRGSPARGRRWPRRARCHVQRGDDERRFVGEARERGVLSITLATRSATTAASITSVGGNRSLGVDTPIVVTTMARRQPASALDGQWRVVRYRCRPARSGGGSSARPRRRGACRSGSR